MTIFYELGRARRIMQQGGEKPEMEIKEDPRKSVIEVLRRIYMKSRSKKSVSNYRWGLESFFRWMGTDDADGIVERAEAGKLDPVETVQRYLFHLNERGLAPATIRLYAVAVRKFFDVNLSVTLNWKRLERPKLRRVVRDRIPTKEEFRRVIDYGDVKDKAFILFALSSGARDETLAGLDVGDVNFEAFPDIALVRVRPEIAKGGIGYTTFITPEAKEALKDYLDLRRREGEELKPGSPLFAHRGKRVNPGSLSLRWRRRLKKAGLDGKTAG